VEALTEAIFREELSQNAIRDLVGILVDMAAHPWSTRAWCPQEIVAADKLIRLLIPCDKELTGNEMFVGIGGEFEVPIRILRNTVSRAHSYMGSYQKWPRSGERR